MADQTQQKRAKIPLKQFLADYRSGLPDRDIMHKYELDARRLVTLIKTLVDKKVLTAQDLTRHKELTQQQESVKETQFLKSLYLCPNCGHPHPHQFDVCPACGASPDETAEIQPDEAVRTPSAEAAQAAPDEIADEVMTTGGHFYVEDLTTDVVERPASEVVPEAPPVASPSEKSAKRQPQSADKPAPSQAKPDKSETPAEQSGETTEKTSPFKSVRALFSRIKKK